MDNEKTDTPRGAGASGFVNRTYRRYATQLKFRVDSCAPRQRKVERRVRGQPASRDLAGQVFKSLEALQAWTDDRPSERATRCRCPVTETSVAEAWDRERTLFMPMSETEPDSFAVVVDRRVAHDAQISFEGRQYGVLFRFAVQAVEARGLASHVLVGCEVIACQPRGTEAQLITVDRHHDGSRTDRVRA